MDIRQMDIRDNKGYKGNELRFTLVSQAVTFGLNLRF